MAKQKLNWTERAAMAICQAATRDCVMHGNPDRPKCTAKNCRIFPIASRAVQQAKAVCGER